MSQHIKPSKTSKKEKEYTGKESPWYFKLHIQDLISPITVKRLQLVYGALLLFALVVSGYLIWENFLREPTGEEYVNEIVNAAGGMEAWNNLKQGEFTRTHNLYADDGDLLRTTRETFYFKKTDEGVKLQIKSIGDDGSTVWVGQDSDGYWASRDDVAADPKNTAREEGMMCDSKFCAPLCASSMAFYRFSMPFKLKDPGINASIMATDQNVAGMNFLKGSGENPTLLDISYDPEVGRDRWRFYVDPQDKLIRKVEYYNKSDMGETRPEEIYWTDHKTEEGITFSHRWTRYWPNGKVMDEYIYSNVDFKTPIADGFFERPSTLAGLVVSE